MKMGVGETLGLIFAGALILGAIALAVWFYVFRRPSLVTGRACSKDADCSQKCDPTDSNCNVFDEYPAEVCVSGVCKSVSCQNNSICERQLPGTTCFGIGCVPLSCRTTNDCIPEGQKIDDVDVVCVYNERTAVGACVPSKPKGGGCYDVNGLSQDSNGNCVVCSASNPSCPPGSYCDGKGRCLTCGDSTDNTCDGKAGSPGAAPWGICKLGETNTCAANVGTQTYSCQNLGGDLTFPDGTKLGSDYGLCLPPSAECAFTWFNTTGTLDGPSTVPTGWCSKDTPFCSTSGQCVAQPTEAGGTICGKIPGSYKNGIASNTYDLTGICSGRLIAADATTDISSYTTTGTPIGRQVCTRNKVSKNAGNCTCTTGRDDCPAGTNCIPFASQSQNQPTTKTPGLLGLCLIASGTGSGPLASPFVPLPGELGYHYANSACLPNSNLGGIPTCTLITPTIAGDPNTQAQGGPGAFCWSTDQCLYQGKKQGTNNNLGALKCSTNNICIGAVF